MLLQLALCRGETRRETEAATQECGKAQKVAGKEEAGTTEANLPDETMVGKGRNESAQQARPAAEKSSKLLSGLLAMNIVFLGVAITLSAIFNTASVPGTHVLILLMVLSALAVGWMTFHKSMNHFVPHQDLHAGAIWLRGAVFLFGVCSVVLDIFKAGYFLQNIDKADTMKVVYPIVEAVFISAQTCILWFNSKDCFHTHRNVTRCGLMLTLATNLVLWMNAVTDDSIHMELEVEEQTTHNGSRTQHQASMNITGHSCQSELCTIFQKGVVLMYPFNIEYCLIASTMLYIMWTNIGRTIIGHMIHPTHKFRGHGLVWGPMLGCVAIIVGLCIFILYQLEVSRDPTQLKPFLHFYVYHIILLSVMSLCSLAAAAVHRWEESNVDTNENPTRSLDVVLLQVAALGQLCISYFSIVAIAFSSMQLPLDFLNLTYSILIIIEHVLQNLFIIQGLHRPHATQELAISSGGINEKDLIADPQQQTLVLEETHGIHDPNPSASSNTKAKEQDNSNDPNGATSCFTNMDLRRTSQVSLQMDNKLNWRRKFLKEISMFMLMSNLILWVMPAFGAHPQFENGLEKQFYGFSVWFAILNFGLPLGVFYRMHSAGNLLEIYLTA
ncbi:proton channel OTOP3-like isoform X2 [Stegostoma tigrinum]|uniref:proton channel OTOP3-like isoform X2 n=1 Tax=Stegostoma tigrinum TaxID=3053191 RepID=UPI0028700043|nr:proton channel OTOP3-like isoform X2 [Stegostoma tigrinum]